MPHKASIAIFRKSIKTDSTVSAPIVPDVVFEAVQRVIDTKSVELVRSTDGIYLIQYSETGPFNEKFGDEWLPVFIMRLIEWTSGGIKKDEMQLFLDNVNAQPT